MNNDSKEKNRPRLLGDYLPCSNGSIRIAMKKKRETKLKRKQQKRIGEILLQLEMIEQQDLTSALHKQRADRLAWCPVFESLSRTELTAIANHFFEISLLAGKQFIFEGEEDPSLYILVDGKVEVFTHNKDNNEIHIAFVKPVEPIGEMGYFLQKHRRTASVRSVEPSELLCTGYDTLTHYFEHVPHVARAFMEVVKQRQASHKKTLNDR